MIPFQPFFQAHDSTNSIQALSQLAAPTYHHSDSLVHHGGRRVQTRGVFPHVQGWAAETQALLAAGKWKMCYHLS